MQIAIAPGELKNLFMMVGDIAPAYLEALRFLLYLVLNLDQLLDKTVLLMLCILWVFHLPRPIQM
jgi:hypothetical protein